MTEADARTMPTAAPAPDDDDSRTYLTRGPKQLTDGIVAALRSVYDPEIPVNVYDLGLIYRIELDDGSAELDMTLTAPGCPVAGHILNQVERAVAGVDGIGNVKVNLVFDPPWDSSRMSDEVKLELGLL